eukprot:RCo007951
MTYIALCTPLTASGNSSLCLLRQSEPATGPSGGAFAETCVVNVGEGQELLDAVLCEIDDEPKLLCLLNVRETGSCQLSVLPVGSLPFAAVPSPQAQGSTPLLLCQMPSRADFSLGCSLGHVMDRAEAPLLACSGKRRCACVASRRSGQLMVVDLEEDPTEASSVNAEDVDMTSGSGEGQ